MNKYFDILFSLAIYSLLAIGLLFWGYVGFRLFKYSENHIGWNVLWSLAIFLPLAGFSLTEYFLSQRRLSLIIAIFAIVSTLAVFALYQFNILIPYEIWIKRGMPKRPF
jgi:hypothetical protein